MEAVREWAISLCSVAVIGAVVRLAAPVGSCEKIIKLALAAITVLILFAPLAGIGEMKIKLETKAQSAEADTGELESAIISQAEKLIKSAVEGSIESILDKHKIVGYKIEVLTNTQSDGSISIECVRLYLPRTANTTELLSEIREKTGIEAELCFEN